MVMENGQFRLRREPVEGRAQAHLEAPDAGPPHAQDYWRINLREDWEITFWSREFGCTEEALREAVRAVGDSAGGVRAHLRGKNQQRRT